MVGQAMSVFIALSLAAASPALAEDTPIVVQVVDAMNKLFGVHPGFRAFHAKGIVVEGSFTASPAAPALSKASLFSGAAVPVTARFSDNGGFPDIADGAADANPRGLAIKFHLLDGSDADMVTNSFKVFPVSTAADLRDLFLAAAASPPDAPKPTALEKFVGAHPSVIAAASTLGTADSFADEEYHGLNAFVLVNGKGERQPVRFIFSPERVIHLDPKDAASRPPNFLHDEIRQRLATGTTAFRMSAQLAQPGDPTNDPARAWPADRQTVELGTLRLNKVVAESEQVEKSLLFLPGQLPAGIEPSDDPMIDIRNGAYVESFSRRNP